MSGIFLCACAFVCFLTYVNILFTFTDSKLLLQPSRFDISLLRVGVFQSNFSSEKENEYETSDILRSHSCITVMVSWYRTPH
jgi:hypothetical protein